MNRCGMKLVDEFPKVSHDFNAIENAWAISRERLDETCPVELESMGPVLEAIARSRTVGQCSQVGSAVVFIDEPERASRGLPLLQPARSSHEVVEARQSRGLECAVWRRACGKADEK